MKYTIRNGVSSPLSERAKQNFRYLLPLLVILAGVLFLTLNPGTNGTKPKPLTLGIYTIKTPASPSNKGGGSTGSKSDNGGGGGSSATSPDLSGNMTASTVAPIAPASGLPGGAAPTSGGTAVLPGGMGGGGGGTTGSTGGTGGTGGGTGNTSAPTVVSTCDNTGGISPLTCSACTTATLIAIGSKALIYSDGTCVVVN